MPSSCTVILDKKGPASARGGVLIAANLTIFTLLAASLQRIERQRDIAQRRLARTNLELEQTVAQRTSELRAQIAILATRNQELGALNRLADRLNSCQSQADICALVTTDAAALLPDLGGGLYLGPPGTLQLAAAWGPPILPATLASGECAALLHLQPMHVDLDAAPLPGASDAFIAPLVAHAAAGGALIVFRCAAAPAPDAEMALRARLVATLADYLALALANRALRESLQAQSRTDPLTGLPNRRAMIERLGTASAETQPLSVLMIDIDHYKRFNDCFGHQAGDAVLALFGGWLREQIRSADLVCRYGGEEFIVVLAGTGHSAAVARAEQLCAAVGALALTFGASDLGRLTLSIGVASGPDHGAESEALIAAADAALYQAKRDGRNRIAAYDDATPAAPRVSGARAIGAT